MSADTATIPGTDVRVFTIALPNLPGPQQRLHAQRELRRLLAAALGVSEDQLVIERDRHGKPQLPGRQLHFNLSHSGRWALVATSATVPVGIDVQIHRSLRDHSWWRRRLCTAAELQHLLRAVDAGADGTGQLLWLWTRKEAVLKAGGEGIVRDLNTIDVLDRVVLDPDHGPFTCLDLQPPAPGYCAAVAFPARPE